MPSLLAAVALLIAVPSALGAVAPRRLVERNTTQPPEVTVKNGSYYGTYLPTYDEDVFLGIPYAQPPTGNLRFRVPQPLNSSWSDTRNATQYSPQCIGYGSDDWILGNYLSEDCLTLNVVRPSGATNGTGGLPVAVWIHGGGYFQGGGSDPRYNLSFIVQESVSARTPIVAVSINYRVAEWGFLYGKELAAEGASNLALRDQRLALRWIHENIAAFGGDPAKVTIWGESAGANSVGLHLVAYGGRDDGLFRAAISESGSPAGLSPYATTESWQPVYDAVVRATNCSSASDSLTCLRAVPASRLSAVFNSTVTKSAERRPVIDGDFLTQSGATAMRVGKFVKVPYLIGANFDEGSAFGKKGINTTAQFLEMVKSAGPDNATASTIAALYPDIPEVGIPATLKGRPPPDQIATYGYQWKRSAAYGGDLTMHAGRRLTSRLWAQNNVSCWTYHFNVLVNGVSPLVGSVHFEEVAFVFHNVQGLGYGNAVAENPFTNKPDTYPQLSALMSRMWISFVAHLDPNGQKDQAVLWPEYTLDDPRNIVFDANASHLAYIEPDTYRAEGIAYIGERLDSVYGY